MRREFSAGGAVVRDSAGGHELAAIRPQGKPEGHWVLPKGALDLGETSEAAALREVHEETGLVASPLGRLGSVRYVYTWAGERVFKAVTFFLMRYESGEIDAIDDAMRVEVQEARWIPLAEAPSLLAHKGERDMARKASAMLGELEL